MSSTLLLLLAVLAVTTLVQAANELDQHDKDHRPKNVQNIACQEFDAAVTFNENKVLGRLHLLHMKALDIERSEFEAMQELKCLELSLLSYPERKMYSQSIGKYLKHINWEKVTLKLAAPCDEIDSNIDEPPILMEKLNDYGLYILIDPKGTPRSTWLLQIIEGQYLAMIVCNKLAISLYGKQQPQDAVTDARLTELGENYWRGYY